MKAEKPLRVRVSSKNQIAVPAAARKRLNIHAGDYLLLDVREGSMVLVPEPKDWLKALRGLGAEIWEGVDAQEYVRGEREAWQK
jgi:AbrB family looped-hinge helix DNA binding protein